MNDAGYVTESSLTTNNYITQNDLITNNYVTEADIPTNVSAFTNDAGYITMDSIPAIPTVPTNVSAFVNDAGYLTTATVQEAANIPTNVSAFTNDAGYITMDSIPAIPTVPTNVSSAFVNDAGYVTESSLTTNNYITQNDLITNNYVTEADIPTNVSAFTNDAGYITMDSVPAIPTNVSAFTNDAGYITNAAIPTNISVFTNDAGYLTSATVQEAANIPTNVSAFTNDAGYITMDSIPAIPTVPTNVSAFTNDAGYITESTLTTNNYITQNDLITNNYVTETDIPTNVSAFTNDAGYITMDSIPAIPTVPTNVSAFVNDAGYLTQATVQEAANIPTNVSAFTNDANYITLAQVPEQVNADWNATSGAAQIMNKPAIPTVPTNVSAFTNDAGYITESTLTNNNYITQNDLVTNNYVTEADIPTNVSAFNNDAGYITMDSIPVIPTVPTNVSAFTNDANYITSEDIPAYQVLSISNDTIYLSNGGYAVLPAGFDGNYNSLSNKPDLFSGNYNDLTNKPTIPTVPTNVSAFTNDANYITEAAIPANVSAFTNDVGYITMDSIPAIPTVPTNVSSFTNDANYITSAAIPSNVSSFTNDAGYLTSFTEQQILSISNDTIYLTGGSFVKLPAGFSGSYNDLTDRPDIPTIPTEVSTFNNDAGYLTSVDCGNINICDLLAEMQSQIEDLRHTVDSLSGPGEAGIVNADPCPETLTDIDGNTYNTVQIGTQCWMKENLRTTKYADNTPIEQGSTASETTPYWYYPGNSSSNKTTYGLLYNWPAVMNGATSSDANPSGVQGVCPTGWHVPSDAEFTQLTEYVSSQSQYVCGSDNDYIAKALAGTTGWSTHTGTCCVGNTPSQNNSTGFSALPAGYYNGSYLNFGVTAIFWSATENASSDAWHRNLNAAGALVGRSSLNKTNGFSVRCVKDDEEEEPCEPTSSTHNAEITTDQLPYVFGDTTFQAGTATGTYILLRTNAAGCDSTITLNLTVTVPAFTCGTSTLTDIDGNTYNTVLIGTQCWMKENLRTTKYADGTSISQGTSTSTTTAHWYYPNNSSSNKPTYGLLYNWPAVMNGATSSDANPSGVQGICPTGWHVPSDAEWTQLTDYVSSQSVYICGSANNNIAKALASKTGWLSSTYNCDVGYTPSNNNATGFSALPAGGYYSSYSNFGNSATFWSTTQYVGNYVYYRYLYNQYSYVTRDTHFKDRGFSVRCVKN